MFYQWAESLGIRLEEMIKTEKASYDHISSTLNESEKQRQLVLQDEEEDFLDECEFELIKVPLTQNSIDFCTNSECQCSRQ